MTVTRTSRGPTNCGPTNFGPMAAYPTRQAEATGSQVNVAYHAYPPHQARREDTGSQVNVGPPGPSAELGRGESDSNVSVPQAQPVLVRTTRDRARQLVYEPTVSIASGLDGVVGGCITTADVSAVGPNVCCNYSGRLGSDVCRVGVPSGYVSNLALSNVSVNTRPNN